MVGVEDFDEYELKVGTVNVALVMNIVDGVQNEIAIAKEKYDKLVNEGGAESEINNAKDHLKSLEEELDKLEDRYITFYIERYLQAQEQTGAAKNGLTFSEDNGAVNLKLTENSKKFQGLWDRFTSWVTGSTRVTQSGGKFTADIGGRIIDLTDEINDIYMPWQYPFAFHNETMSPDVGYLVANLSKYHNIDILVDFDEILILKVKWEPKADGTGNEFTSVQAYWLNDEYAFFGFDKEIIARNPNALISQATTWYSTYKYTYEYNGYFKNTVNVADELVYNWDVNNPTKSKFDDEGKEKIKNSFSIKDGKVYCSLTDDYPLYSQFTFHDNIGANEQCFYHRLGLDESTTTGFPVSEPNTQGIEEMEKILLEFPQYDDQGKIKNKDKVPRYYIANRSTKDHETGVYTAERSMLNIKTNADAIIQAIDEIYQKEKVEPEKIAGDGKDKDNLSEAEFAEMKEKTTKFMPDTSVKMVADIFNFFNSNNIIDPANYYGSIDEGAAYSNMDLVWFLDQDANMSDIGTGNPATISSVAGTTVFSPITGKITEVDESTGTITITKYGTYEEAVEAGVIAEDEVVPEGEVHLFSVRIQGIHGVTEGMVGNSVTAGSTTLGKVDGVTGDNSSIRVSYMNRGGGLATDLRERLEIAVTRENAQFIFPLPADSGYVLTSSFGPRVNPVTGVYQKAHGALDFGVAGGTPIFASADGTVAVASYVKGYGNVVYINHDGGYQTRYAHMIELPCVKVGQEVVKGQQIGKVGSTGNSTGNHLHFEIIINGTKVDPTNYIGGQF